MKIINRLKQYIDIKGISLNAFDKSIEASNGYIGKLIKNNSSLGGDVIEKIVSAYIDINVEWLITGQGEMLKSEVAKPPEVECTNCKELEKDLQHLKEIIKSKEEIIFAKDELLDNYRGNTEKRKAG